MHAVRDEAKGTTAIVPKLQCHSSVSVFSDISQRQSHGIQHDVCDIVPSRRNLISLRSVTMHCLWKRAIRQSFSLHQSVPLPFKGSQRLARCQPPNNRRIDCKAKGHLYTTARPKATCTQRDWVITLYCHDRQLIIEGGLSKVSRNNHCLASPTPSRQIVRLHCLNFELPSLPCE
jgi:hypothetical protein